LRPQDDRQLSAPGQAHDRTPAPEALEDLAAAPMPGKEHFDAGSDRPIRMSEQANLFAAPL
jgi:hypothetical protein